MNSNSKHKDYSKDNQNFGRNNNRFNKSLNENISTKPSGTISNADSINKLMKGELPGMSTNNRVGVLREMAPTSKPNETAKDFSYKYAKSKGYELSPPEITNGIYRYDINGGVKNGGKTILYRPAGKASVKTTNTTVNVEINGQDLRNINNDQQLKLKFPIKSEVK